MTTMKLIVKLISKTNQPIQTMATAARLCYFKGESMEMLRAKMFSDTMECEKLLHKIIKSRHLSILEHASFTFGIEGIGRNCTHQLVRHRNTSFAQQSLHYTEASNCNVVMPRNVTPEQKEIVERISTAAFFGYKELIALGMAKEEARHILPSGIETKIIATANLRQWMSFITQRMCNVNCEEIRVLATVIKDIIISEIPMLSQYLGPNCVTCGVCVEGKKFCCKPKALPVIVRDGREVLAKLKTGEEVHAYARDFK